MKNLFPFEDSNEKKDIKDTIKWEALFFEKLWSDHVQETIT